MDIINILIYIFIGAIGALIGIAVFFIQKALYPFMRKHKPKRSLSDDLAPVSTPATLPSYEENTCAETSFDTDQIQLLLVNAEKKAEDSFTGFASGIVDTVDMIASLLDNTANKVSHGSLENIYNDLISVLKRNHIDLINDDHWNPERQRAFAIDTEFIMPETAPSTSILRKESSGFTYKGKVRRKQEVALLQKKPQL